jgi:hypothetical protein
LEALAGDAEPVVVVVVATEVVFGARLGVVLVLVGLMEAGRKVKLDEDADADDVVWTSGLASVSPPVTTRRKKGTRV